MLRTAREQAGLSQGRLAVQLGVSPGYVAKLEHGTRCPSTTVAHRLAAVLDLDAEQLELVLSAAVDDAGADHPYRRRAA